MVDVINAETNVDDILFDYEPIDTIPNVQPAPEPTLNFSDILLPKNNAKTKAAENFFKKYQKMRKNNDTIKKATQKAIQNLKGTLMQI